MSMMSGILNDQLAKAGYENIQAHELAPDFVLSESERAAMRNDADVLMKERQIIDAQTMIAASQTPNNI